jgi:methylated-DNA-[protein]-cysteine S-methyltransferase
MRAHIFASPVGEILAAVNERGALVRLDFLTHKDRAAYLERIGPVEWDAAALAEVQRQVGEYFAKRRRDFDLALAPEGTAFQLRVWAELRRIPYGSTLSYGELAERVGNRKGSRAVGAANGANPIGLVVPCHRVIGADGSLTGYGGGLPIKEALLQLEGARLV